MTIDKRQVHTDALATLGTIITDKEKRDAIHLAVIPMQAKTKLMPGEHLDSSGNRAGVYGDESVGIIDPFLDDEVKPGEWFWLVIYPRTIKSLRHVWEHPAFPDEGNGVIVGTENISLGENPGFAIASPSGKRNVTQGILLEDTKIEESKKWIKEYAKTVRRTWSGGYGEKRSNKAISYDELMDGARQYLEDGERLKLGDNEEQRFDAEEFWGHYEIVTGTKVDSYKKRQFFRCAC